MSTARCADVQFAPIIIIIIVPVGSRPAACLMILTIIIAVHYKGRQHFLFLSTWCNCGTLCLMRSFLGRKKPNAVSSFAAFPCAALERRSNWITPLVTLFFETSFCSRTLRHWANWVWHVLYLNVVLIWYILIVKVFAHTNTRKSSIWYEPRDIIQTLELTSKYIFVCL